MFVLFSLIRRSRNTTGDRVTERKEKKKIPGSDCLRERTVPWTLDTIPTVKSPFPVVVVVVVVGLLLLPFAFRRRVPMLSPALHTCSLRLASARRATEDRIPRLGLGAEGPKKRNG